MRNRIFFPQAALDEWVEADRVDLRADELLIKGEGRRYRIIEGVRILREVAGCPDTNELVGKVKTRAFLKELGGEIVEASMILGDNAYDVVTGFVGAPIGSFEEHKRSASEAPASNRAAASDEDLLAAFLAAKL